ncbi:hypothetical protein CONLIGDRAFT_672644 [Coniochaeta ligniaria NRRL 30616]|uniref:Uncharacterized protein n=1 Tax=Coniochaeta ligniaria NRRL 30616 TaxID=1408157 RepID=A0A1J7J791_9PEZI|nr:hypothetical protein CONLIGDRAFT_672644 [Coniochaeta ligniaria NRRL 30616]
MKNTVCNDRATKEDRALWQKLCNIFGGKQAAGSDCTVDVPAPSARISRLRYSILTTHCPFEFQSEDAFKNAPWAAQILQAFNDPLTGRFRWRELAGKCYYDMIGIQNDPSLGQRTFARDIKYRQLSSDGHRIDMDVTVRIFSKDAQWLASLSRACIETGNLISVESAVRVDGLLYPSEDLLAPVQHFYLQFLKSWRMALAKERAPYGRRIRPVPSPTYSSWDFDEFLDIDLPEIRHIVYRNVMADIEHPGDVRTAAVKV